MTSDGGRESGRVTGHGADDTAPDPEVVSGPEVQGASGDSEVPPVPPRPVNPRSIPKEPEWADQRTILSDHPRWALATVALLVIGLIVGYTSVVAVGPSLIRKCAALADLTVCNPRTQGLVLALPALALALGLAVSWIGGRRLARRGRKAIHAAVAGWAVFLLTAVICYGVVGGHA